MRRERSPWCAWHRETWGRFWTFYRWELKVRTVVLQLYFNFPQSCNMAFGKVTEDNVYTCVGEWLSCSHCWTIVFSISVLLDDPSKVTPFALTSQTSQTGPLMKTSAQHTGIKPIEMIWKSLQNFDISSISSQVSKLKTLKGLSLQDILAEVHHYVHKLDLPAQVAPFFLSTEYLSDVF